MRRSSTSSTTALAGWIPSYAAIAVKAGVSVCTMVTALKRLREIGILDWVRRCAESWADGRFVLQGTMAYAVLPESQWCGYSPPPEPPTAPLPGTWGEPAPVLSALAQAALKTDPNAKEQVLAINTMTPLERALAATREFFRVQQMRSLKTYPQRPAGTVSQRKQDAQQQEAAGGLCRQP